MMVKPYMLKGGKDVFAHFKSAFPLPMLGYFSKRKSTISYCQDFEQNFRKTNLLWLEFPMKKLRSSMCYLGIFLMVDISYIPTF